MLTIADFSRIYKANRNWNSLDILSEITSVTAEIFNEEETLHSSHSPKKNENNQKKKKKKKKVLSNYSGPDPPPDLPLNFVKRIRQINGKDIVLVIQKPLLKSDTSKGVCRFLIPVSDVKEDFLTKNEKALLNTHNSFNNKPMEIEASLIDPWLQEKNIRLRKWEMKKKNQKKKYKPSYVLVNGWYSIVEENQLEVDVIVQLWSFRVDSRPWFALVVVNTRGEEQKEENGGENYVRRNSSNE